MIKINASNALTERQQDLGVDELNRNAILQSNQQQLEFRGQNMNRELGLRNLFMSRSPLSQALDIYNVGNTLSMNRTAAQNQAQFQRSGLEQQKFAEEQRHSGPLGAVMKGVGAIGGQFLGGIANRAGQVGGTLLGNKIIWVNNMAQQVNPLDVQKMNQSLLGQFLRGGNNPALAKPGDGLMKAGSEITGKDDVSMLMSGLLQGMGSGQNASEARAAQQQQNAKQDREMQMIEQMMTANNQLGAELTAQNDAMKADTKLAEGMLSRIGALTNLASKTDADQINAQQNVLFDDIKQEFGIEGIMDPNVKSSNPLLFYTTDENGNSRKIYATGEMRGLAARLASNNPEISKMLNENANNIEALVEGTFSNRKLKVDEQKAATQQENVSK